MEIKLGSWSGFILGVVKLHRYVYNDGDVRRVWEQQAADNCKAAERRWPEGHDWSHSQRFSVGVCIF